MRKWEFVAHALRRAAQLEQDLQTADWIEDAAAIADEIDALLQDLYGEKHTVAWECDYDEFAANVDFYVERGNVDGILSVAELVACEADYCVACEAHVDCDECRYAMEAGGCNEDGSMLDRFMRKLAAVRRYGKAYKQGR